MLRPGTPDSSTTQCGVGMASRSNTRLLIALSMASALASTPEPVYTLPASSSAAWMVPSSPYVPCSAMNTTSAAVTAGDCTAASMADSGSLSTASRLGALASSLPAGSTVPSAASTDVTS